jgi:V/A-type H+-transporting ATPase subunit I
LSLFIGMREGYRHGHLKHAREKLAMLLSLAALGIALVSSTGRFPLGTGAGYGVAAVVFAAALINFVRGMGPMAPMGVMEIFGLCANIFSYSRLMALGIASIAFADIANMLPEMLGGGVAGILIGIPLALVVHAFNIGLGVFSPTIHSLRLNIVEFMPKFYEPEGTMYKPFRKELAW